jgi:FtsH-binding integral membrane protein
MFTSNTYTETKKGYDEGLRQYFLSVYNYVALALAITGIAAFASLSFQPLRDLLYLVGPAGELISLKPLGWIVNFCPLGLAIFFMMGFANMDLRKAQNLFWIYSATMGVSLSYLGLIYTGGSLVKTFFICSASFAGMSIYGYSTKRDLTSFGQFFMVGLIGLFIASLINMFLNSPAIYYATSFIGIFVFLGLIAWDTQKIKMFYYQAGGGEYGQKMAILAALSLYMDFINLFIYMLRFFGDRRN